MRYKMDTVSLILASSVFAVLLVFDIGTAGEANNTSSITNTTNATNKGCFEHVNRTWHEVKRNFSILPCMNCHCNMNSTLTCYRRIASDLTYGQCVGHGNASNRCSANETKPTGYQQFCFNCETSKQGFRSACKLCQDNYRKKYYHTGRSWKPNKCTTCICVEGKIKCVYDVPKVTYMPGFAARCTNCNLTRFISYFPCKSCWNYMTGKWYASGASWWINKCFICQCFAGKTFCRKEGISFVIRKGVRYLHLNPLCKNCRTYKLIDYVRKHQCKVCNDAHNEVIRLHKEMFRVRNDAFCNCNDGRIECMKIVNTEIARIFRLPKIRPVCNHCSADDIKKLKEAKGCKLLNVTIGEGKARHIASGEMPYCMHCYCLLGEITCFYSVQKQQLQKFICLTEERCASDAVIVGKSCQRNARLNCHNDPPVVNSWMANGCSYSCNGTRLSYKIIHRPWCQTISKLKYCAICPDKKAFFKKYNDIFTTCKRYPEAIYREWICDGQYNCIDKSDEENCTSYYCRKDEKQLVKKTFLWKRTLVGATKELGCEHINEHWSGALYRTCKFNSKIGTFWEDINHCNCSDSRPDPFDIKRLPRMSVTDLKLAAESLLNYSKGTVSLKHSLQLAVVLMNETLKMMFINRTGELVSFGQSVADLWKSTLSCSEKEEVTLKAKLKSQIIELRFTYGLYINMKNKKVRVGRVKVWVTSFDALFLPEVLFGSGTTAKKPEDIDSLQRTLNIRHGHGNATTNATTTTTNKSSASGPKINVQRVHNKVSRHVKIIYGLDAVFSMASLLALVLALLCLFSLSLPRTTKWYIRKNLFSAMGTATCLYVISIWAEYKMTRYRWLCSTFVLANYYSSLAVYTWMSVEGVNLLLLVVLVFQRKSKSHLQFAAAGWGLPLLALGISLAVNPSAFVNTKGCISLGNNSWLFKGPAAAVISANFVMFAIIFFTLMKKMKSSRRLKTNADRWRSSAKAFLTLMPLLGVTYLLGFALDSGYIAITYIYLGVNGLMGVVFAVVHVFMDPQVKEGLTKFKTRRSTLFQSNSDDYSSKKLAKKQRYRSETLSTTAIVEGSPKERQDESVDTKL